MALRSAVFAILRRHEVSEQCFAEVASITHHSLTTTAETEHLRDFVRYVEETCDDEHYVHKARQALAQKGGESAAQPVPFVPCQSGCKWPNGSGPTLHSKHCNGSLPGKAVTHD